MTAFIKESFAVSRHGSCSPAHAILPVYFTEMCGGSEAGSYLRLIDFVNHSTLGLRVIRF